MRLLSRLFNRLLAAWHERALVLKAASFAIVGAMNTAVDVSICSFGYYYLNFQIVLANVVSWSIAVTSSYVLNSLTTFAHESGRQLTMKAYFNYVLAQSAGLVANTATVYVAAFFMPAVIGKLLLATVASFVVNFSLSHFVVFRKREQPN